METTLKGYMDLGVLREKLFYTQSPSICLWSITRNCLVGGVDKYPAEELVKDGKNYKVTYENNRMVSLKVRTGIAVDEINNSAGIIITDCDDGFCYDYVPIK